MRVLETETFLRQKLFNLRRRLWEDHGADARQLDVIEAHLTADSEKGLTTYASQLHQRWCDLPTRAAQIVEFVAVPEQNKEKAIEVVKEYLTAFVSVVQPDPIS